MKQALTISEIVAKHGIVVVVLGLILWPLILLTNFYFHCYLFGLKLQRAYLLRRNRRLKARLNELLVQGPPKGTA